MSFHYSYEILCFILREFQLTLLFLILLELDFNNLTHLKNRLPL
jgi:hypothetical protein